MRINNKDVNITPGRVHVRTAWLDRMRRPATVKVIIEKNVSSAGLSTLIDGDPRDVSKTLQGIAEIAWSMGWRPTGLDTALIHALRTHNPSEGG